MNNKNIEDKITNSLSRNYKVQVTLDLKEDRKERTTSKLYATDIGKSCDRALYFDITSVQENINQSIVDSSVGRFNQGNLIESFIVSSLLKEVPEGRTQERVTLSVPKGSYKNVDRDWEVSGNIDFLIEEDKIYLFEIKTASMSSYKLLENCEDVYPYGYLEQISFYYHRLKEKYKKEVEAHFIFYNKNNGAYTINNPVIIDENTLYQKIEQKIVTLDYHITTETKPEIPLELRTTKPYLTGKCFMCKYNIICWGAKAKA